jgi:hypothetical protein
VSDSVCGGWIRWVGKKIGPEKRKWGGASRVFSLSLNGDRWVLVSVFHLLRREWECKHGLTCGGEMRTAGTPRPGTRKGVFISSPFTESLIPRILKWGFIFTKYTVEFSII